MLNNDLMVMFFKITWNNHQEIFFYDQFGEKLSSLSYDLMDLHFKSSVGFETDRS